VGVMMKGRRRRRKVAMANLGRREALIGMRREREGRGGKGVIIVIMRRMRTPRSGRRRRRERPRRAECVRHC